VSKEEPFLPRAEAEQVRKEIAATGRKALAHLTLELGQYGVRSGRGGSKYIELLPESWVDKFRKIADQLRRDYRLEPGMVAESGDRDRTPKQTNSDDPLAGLKLVSENEVA
jgi:hypothetical protein